MSVTAKIPLQFMPWVRAMATLVGVQILDAGSLRNTPDVHLVTLMGDPERVDLIRTCLLESEKLRLLMQS